MNTILRSPVDQTHDVRVFFETPDVPVFCNLLWDSVEAASSAPRGDITLGYSPESAHIFNTTFDAARTDYDQAYENSLHFSPRFQQFAENLCKDLIERYDLHGKTIIDIGCGKGDFLKMICAMGKNRGIGFDKSYVPQPEDAENDQVTFVIDFYTKAYADQYQADFIACRHVLEHIEDPRPFLQGIRDAIGERLDTVVYFEVPNALYTLRDLGIWDIIYEHCGYYTPNSIAYLFRECGFEVKRVDEVFMGQYLTIEAAPSASVQAHSHHPTYEEMPRLIDDFSRAYRDVYDTWKTRLADFAAAGKKVVIWGGGSKGVTFLNVLNTQDIIKYVVDINPRKQGKYVAGTGQQIIDPSFLKTYQPDAVIIMNPIYTEEIKTSVAALGIEPEFYTV